MLHFLQDNWVNPVYPHLPSTTLLPASMYSFLHFFFFLPHSLPHIHNCFLSISHSRSVALERKGKNERTKVSDEEEANQVRIGCVLPLPSRLRDSSTIRAVKVAVSVYLLEKVDEQAQGSRPCPIRSTALFSFSCRTQHLQLGWWWAGPPES